MAINRLEMCSLSGIWKAVLIYKDSKVNNMFLGSKENK